MILAFHVIFTAYGFWLPNDPRGSWSTWIRQWELLRFGPATKISTRRSVAHQPHDWKLRQAAKEALTYKPVVFSGLQGRAVGQGFATAIEDAGYQVWACSFLPEHVHMVIARHGRQIKQIVGHLKSAASTRLAETSTHPFLNDFQPDGTRVSPWARRFWRVYLNTHGDIVRSIDYVRENPVKEGRRRQWWYFETPYPHYPPREQSRPRPTAKSW
jgi:REP element-mobilizing transposase RayT